jgi:uncharacterized protein (TIRG00374 family)
MVIGKAQLERLLTPGMRTWLLSFWPNHRIRRLLDAAQLAAFVATVIGLLVLAALNPGLLQTLADLTPGTGQGWVRSAVAGINIVASVAVFAVLCAIVIDALRFRPFTLTRAALACALGAISGVALARLLNVVGGSSAMALLAPAPPASPGLTVTAVVAGVVGADLERRRLRLAVRVAFATAIGCALILGSLTVPSLAYAALVGGSVGLGVRAVLGVRPARPSDELMRSVLAAAGWPLEALRPVRESAGRSRYEGLVVDGGIVQITVVDRDRRGVPLARRAARLLFLRAAAVGRPALSLRWQLERQTLCAGLAQSAGVASPTALALLAAGPALVLVERPLQGEVFARKDSPTAADCTSIVASLRRLHDVGMSLGAVASDGIALLPDGRAGFTDLVAAQPAATELQRELDVVILLAALASKVGAPGAVAALRSGYGTTTAMESRLAALEQPVALPRSARRLVRGTPVLKDLRTELSGGPDSTGVVTAPPRLERLRPRTVISVVGGAVAAYLLASQLSQVNLVDALRQSNPAWLAVALSGSGLTYLGSAMAKRPFAPTELPLGRTTLVQLASSFLALVTPPSVGHVGVNLRYLQRAGLTTAVAATSVAASEIVVIVVTVVMLLVCLWLSGASSSQLALLPSATVLYILLGAATLLAFAVGLPFTRRFLQRRLQPLLRRTLPQVLATVSDPRRLVAAIIGVVLLNGGYVLALEASMLAFGTSISLPLLVVVYFAGSAIGAAAPTPGGVGAVEAALVAGLTATGISVTSALTAVLVFRAATFWLPAPLGWGAFLVLQRRGWI